MGLVMIHRHICLYISRFFLRTDGRTGPPEVEQEVLVDLKILVEFDSLGLNALPNLLSFNSFADHLSLQRPLFCDKKNRWGNNHRKLYTYTLKQHMFGQTFTQIQKQTNHLQWLRHCCKTRTPMILTFMFYHSNFIQ